MEKVFSIVGMIYDRKPTDNLNSLDVNTATWSIFIHWIYDPSRIFEVCGSLFSENWEVDERADGDHMIVTAVRILKSKTYFFWLGAMFGRHQSRTSLSLEGKINWYLETTYLKELDQIGGEQMEFEWKFSMIHYIGILQWDSKDWRQNWCVNLSNFKEGSSSCPCSMMFFGELQEMKKIVFRIPWLLQHTPEGFHSDFGHIWDLVLIKVVWNSRQQAKWWVEQSCWEHDDSLERGELESWKWWKENPFTTSEMKKPWNWLLARRDRRIYRTDHLHVDVQRHLMGI